MERERLIELKAFRTLWQKGLCTLCNTPVLYPVLKQVPVRSTSDALSSSRVFTPYGVALERREVDRSAGGEVEEAEFLEPKALSAALKTTWRMGSSFESAFAGTMIPMHPRWQQ